MENVGVLPDLSFNLDGMTVITGLNSTGKSTILKTVYSVLDASELEYRKDDEAFFALYPILRKKDPDMFRKSPYTGNEAIREYLKSLREFDKLTPAEAETVQYIENLISGKEDDSFHKSVLTNNIKAEFQTLSQMMSDGSNGTSRVFLEHLGIERSLVVSSDGLDWTGDYQDLPGVAYYDTPFVLDELMGDIISGHRTSISQMVLSSKNSGIVSEAISDRRLEDFGKCISRVLPGEIFYNENREFLGYSQPGKKPIGVSNLAAGMKVFAILRKLIENGYITKDFVMLMDEPEIHLHPQWQVTLAEALVILTKSVGCKILMTTHSPLLLRSLQAYSSIHEQDVKYYLLERNSERIGERTDITFRDLGGDAGPAYRSMSEAYDRAQNLFYGD